MIVYETCCFKYLAKDDENRYKTTNWLVIPAVDVDSCAVKVIATLKNYYCLDCVYLIPKEMLIKAKPLICYVDYESKSETFFKLLKRQQK